jgi:hypothetical protein
LYILEIEKKKEVEYEKKLNQESEERVGENIKNNIIISDEKKKKEILIDDKDFNKFIIEERRKNDISDNYNSINIRHDIENNDNYRNKSYDNNYDNFENTPSSLISPEKSNVNNTSSSFPFSFSTKSSPPSASMFSSAISYARPALISNSSYLENNDVETLKRKQQQQQEYRDTLKFYIHTIFQKFSFF